MSAIPPRVAVLSGDEETTKTRAPGEHFPKTRRQKRQTEGFLPPRALAAPAASERSGMFRRSAETRAGAVIEAGVLPDGKTEAELATPQAWTAWGRRTGGEEFCRMAKRRDRVRRGAVRSERRVSAARYSLTSDAIGRFMGLLVRVKIERGQRRTTKLFRWPPPKQP